LADEPDHADEIPGLDLDSLSDLHPGLTREVGAAYEQATAVCLSRHHHPPAILSVSHDSGGPVQYRVIWPVPDARIRAAWANDDDATRDGAYGVVLAAAEAHLGLVAFARTPVGSGSDYFLVPSDNSARSGEHELDADTLLRLEVSGIDRSRGDAHLRRRVREKIMQARAGQSDHPAIVGVVAFNMLRIVFRRVR
jgi:hypothetical protein